MPSDFLAVLPFDLTYAIFNCLDFPELAICSAVSRRWRLFLFQWPGMWQTIALKPGQLWPCRDGRSLFDNGCREWLSFVQPESVRYFEYRSNQPRYHQQVFRFLRDVEYPRLQSLKLVSRYATRPMV